MNKLLFLYRLLKHLMILFLISLPLQAVSLVVVPIILLKIKDSIRFPYFFKWFDSADIWFGRDTSTYESIIKEGFLKRWYWLSLRNPLNYFGYKVLGKQVLASYLPNVPTLIGDSKGKTVGFMYQEMNLGDTIGYEYYWIYKWNETHCLRFRLGYKIGNPAENPFNSYIEQVFVFQPYKSYTGT